MLAFSYSSEEPQQSFVGRHSVLSNPAMTNLPRIELGSNSSMTACTKSLLIGFRKPCDLTYPGATGEISNSAIRPFFAYVAVTVTPGRTKNVSERGSPYFRPNP